MTLLDGDAAGSDATSDRHVSGSTLWNLVHLVRQERGDDGVAKVLALAGEDRSADEIGDDGTWSSFEQTKRLLEATCDVLGDPLAAERVGTSTAAADMTSEVVSLLRTLGSPGELLRHIREAAAKFCTVVDMEPIEINETSGLVAARTVPGFPRFEMLCHFTRGLLAQVPVPFDLPPAEVVELECELRGAAQCVFRVRWAGDIAAGADGDAVRLASIEARLEALQQTAADLVSAEDLSDLLQRITDRAGAAVRAPVHVLAVSLDGGTHISSAGCTAAEASRIADEIMTEAPDDAAGSRLVVDVRTARRHYGRLAAVYDQGLRFFAAERLLLSTYAGLAAVALDAATSLDRSRREAARASALLRLARALADADGVANVADAVAEHLRELVSCDATAVCLLDADGTLGVYGLSATGDTNLDFLRSLRVKPSESESLRAMLEAPHPRVTELANATPFVAGLLMITGHRHLATVPITAHGEVVGLITAGYLADIRPTPDLVQRLEGVAGLAATAVTKAQLVERIQEQAMVDDLTGLPNRRLLEDRVAQAIGRWERHMEPFALCFLDLDRFKHVNDELGHSSGDLILAEAGNRLRRVLRTEDTVARFGGDEYALILPGVTSGDEAGLIATKVLDALQEPFDLGGQPIYVSASLGFAFAPMHGQDFSTLLKNADLAMYRSKGTPDRWTVYRPEIRAHRPAQASVESGLRQALANDELVVHYQPQIDLRSGNVVAVEALVRWERPGRGLVPPNEFIPLAEETGLIVELDRWVIRRATQAGADWNRRFAGLRVAANLSGQTLLSPGIGDFVADALSRSGLSADRFELEITETAVHGESERLTVALEALERTGTRLAIDDFGTGHSGLSRLHQFPFDVVKIDRSFVTDVSEEEQTAPLLAAMITLAHHLNLVVVAEGVETAAQEAFLSAQACELAQGFYYSRAVPAADVDALLRSSTRP